MIIVFRFDGVMYSGTSLIELIFSSKIGYNDGGASVAIYYAFIDVLIKGS